MTDMNDIRHSNRPRRGSPVILQSLARVTLTFMLLTPPPSAPLIASLGSVVGGGARDNTALTTCLTRDFPA
ncbi:hypothetical protein E2C01_043074 [Portunus trituberculatus]|uniref:Uncharacterized protein n=1 Tax=Portunus trituberculatus TaxID=210409 RepID=A0A5B7FYE3_PORTR|nr:hypothetical protein [Portunus trituberculatus]